MKIYSRNEIEQAIDVPHIKNNSSTKHVTSCRDVLVWGRDPQKAKHMALDPYLEGFNISVAHNIEELARQCNLIVTTTPSTTPLLFGHHLQLGTHVTAIGADEAGKQELDATVFDRADFIAVDSLLQCLRYGDLSHAKEVDLSNVIELGQWIQEPRKREDYWITIADLTGVAIEDLQIAKAVYSKLI